MAHWNTEDHGFGGQYYKCSECGEGWYDISTKDISMRIECPNCGAVINEDETEYVDDKPTNFATQIWSRSTVRASLQAYCEREMKLIQLTGYDLEKLIELFAAGYELRPPEYKTMNDVLRDITR